MLKTEAEYNEALTQLYKLMPNDAEPKSGSPEEIRLDRLATLIEVYEDEHYPVEPFEATRPRE